MKKDEIVLPAEWYPQSAVQLTWPHEDTDWSPILEEVIPCFVAIAREIAKREKLLIVCRNENSVRQQLEPVNERNVLYYELPSNDTWARDHGPLTVFINGNPFVCDFVFNGWGMKFSSDEDNRITRRLYKARAFDQNVTYRNCLDFVLEGGSLESDGKGTVLTTYTCLGSENRNDTLDKKSIEKMLRERLGTERILWLHHGYLAGDDTDSHIDTLARFCDEQTIAYVSSEDPEDEHYTELQAMAEELQTFRTAEGKAYRLIPLPMARKVEWEGERLPATYANFLIMNGAVLVPVYGFPEDEIALSCLRKVFPGRKIVGINCLPLIKQHGSLHCVTMQFPEGVVR